MAKERLSKLQKWILMALYLMGTGYRIKVTDLKQISIHGLKLWGKSETLEWPWRGKGPHRDSMDVSFSRSLRKLEEKELIFTYAHTAFNSMAGIYDLQGITREGKQKIKEKMGIGKSGKIAASRLDGVNNIMDVALTDEGETKVKELLNVKNVELNNKDERR